MWVMVSPRIIREAGSPSVGCIDDAAVFRKSYARLSISSMVDRFLSGYVHGWKGCFLVHRWRPFDVPMFAEDHGPFMLFLSWFHVWHAGKGANSSHGDKIPIGRIEVLTHAAVKKGVEVESPDVFQRG